MDKIHLDLLMPSLGAFFLIDYSTRFKDYNRAARIITPDHLLTGWIGRQ